MTLEPENALSKPPRVNISITGEAALEIEQLRTLLEKHLLQRLSIAQVIKRMTKENLATLMNNNK